MFGYTLAIVLVLGAWPTQARPNFTGKWTLVPDPNTTPRGRGADDTDRLTITHSADTLTVEQMGGGPNPTPIRMIYRLDGSETTLTVMRSPVVTTAKWDGSKLVTTVTGPSAEWKDVWSLEGGRLTIVTTTPGRTLTITRTYGKS